MRSRTHACRRIVTCHASSMESTWSLLTGLQSCPDVAECMSMAAQQLRRAALYDVFLTWYSTVGTSAETGPAPLRCETRLLMRILEVWRQQGQRKLRHKTLAMRVQRQRRAFFLRRWRLEFTLRIATKQLGQATKQLGRVVLTRWHIAVATIRCTTELFVERSARELLARWLGAWRPAARQRRDAARRCLELGARVSIRPHEVKGVGLLHAWRTVASRRRREQQASARVKAARASRAFGGWCGVAMDAVRWKFRGRESVGRAFAVWRVRTVANLQERFASSHAEAHHRRATVWNALRAWRAQVDEELWGARYDFRAARRTLCAWRSIALRRCMAYRAAGAAFKQRSFTTLGFAVFGWRNAVLDTRNACETMQAEGVIQRLREALASWRQRTELCSLHRCQSAESEIRFVQIAHLNGLKAFAWNAMQRRDRRQRAAAASSLIESADRRRMQTALINWRTVAIDIARRCRVQRRVVQQHSEFRRQRAVQTWKCFAIRRRGAARAANAFSDRVRVVAAAAIVTWAALVGMMREKARSVTESRSHRGIRAGFDALRSHSRCSIVAHRQNSLITAIRHASLCRRALDWWSGIVVKTRNAAMTMAQRRAVASIRAFFDQVRARVVTRPHRELRQRQACQAISQHCLTLGCIALASWRTVTAALIRQRAVGIEVVNYCTKSRGRRVIAKWRRLLNYRHRDVRVNTSTACTLLALAFEPWSTFVEKIRGFSKRAVQRRDTKLGCTAFSLWVDALRAVRRAQRCEAGVAEAANACKSMFFSAWHGVVDVDKLRCLAHAMKSTASRWRALCTQRAFRSWRARAIQWSESVQMVDGALKWWRGVALRAGFRTWRQCVLLSKRDSETALCVSSLLRAWWQQAARCKAACGFRSRTRVAKVSAALLSWHCFAVSRRQEAALLDAASLRGAERLQERVVLAWREAARQLADGVHALSLSRWRALAEGFFVFWLEASAWRQQKRQCEAELRAGRLARERRGALAALGLAAAEARQRRQAELSLAWRKAKAALVHLRALARVRRQRRVVSEAVSEGAEKRALQDGLRALYVGARARRRLRELPIAARSLARRLECFMLADVLASWREHCGDPSPDPEPQRLGASVSSSAGASSSSTLVPAWADAASEALNPIARAHWRARAALAHRLATFLADVFAAWRATASPHTARQNISEGNFREGTAEHHAPNLGGSLTATASSESSASTVFSTGIAFPRRRPIWPGVAWRPASSVSG